MQFVFLFETWISTKISLKKILKKRNYHRIGHGERFEDGLGELLEEVGGHFMHDALQQTQVAHRNCCAGARG